MGRLDRPTEVRISNSDKKTMYTKHEQTHLCTYIHTLPHPLPHPTNNYTTNYNNWHMCVCATYPAHSTHNTVHPYPIHTVHNIYSMYVNNMLTLVLTKQWWNGTSILYNGMSAKQWLLSNNSRTAQHLSKMILQRQDGMWLVYQAVLTVPNCSIAPQIVPFCNRFQRTYVFLVYGMEHLHYIVTYCTSQTHTHVHNTIQY